MNIGELGQNFKALLEACAGPDRKEQEEYLIRAVLKFMIEHYGRNPKLKLPDGNVLLKYGLSDVMKKEVASEELLDMIYSTLSKSLLNDVGCQPNDLRSKVMEYMCEDLERRRKIQEEAGISAAKNC